MKKKIISILVLVLMIIGVSGCGSKGLSDNKIKIKEAESSADNLQEGLSVFIEYLPEVVREVFMSMLPLVIMFAVFQILLLKLPPVQIRKVAQGILYCFFGLILFLVGYN